MPPAFRCDEIARGGELTIDGDTLHTGRWCITDLTDLWENAQRGEDTEIASYEGVIPFPKRFAATRYLLPLTISGWVDAADDPVEEPMIQLRTNVTAFKAAFQGSSLPIVYETSNGETWTSICHVHDIRKDSTLKGWWTGNLEITLLEPWVVT